MITIKARVLLCNNDTYKFWDLDFAKKNGFSKTAVKKDYKQVYEENIRVAVNPSKDEKLEILEGFWEKFNVNHPADSVNVIFLATFLIMLTCVFSISRVPIGFLSDISTKVSVIYFSLFQYHTQTFLYLILPKP